MRQQAVQHGVVEEVAVGLDQELRAVAEVVVEAGERVEEQVGPDEHLAARHDDAIDGDVVGVGQVCDTT
jgi:hypothetical protein